MSSSAQPTALSGKDKLRMTFRTLIQLVPFGIGSAIDVAVFGTAAERQVKRVEAAVERMAKELDEYADNIDVGYFDTDEFHSLFRRCFEGIVREHQKLKIRCIQNVLSRNVIEGVPAMFDFDAYALETIRSLTVDHIQCLAVISSPVKEEHQGSKGTGFHPVDHIAKQVNLPDFYVSSLLSHLKSIGLAHGEMGMGLVGHTQVSGAASFLASKTGILLLKRVSDLGKTPPTTERSNEQKLKEAGAKDGARTDAPSSTD